MDFYWRKELEEYIGKSDKSTLTVQNIAKYLEVSPCGLCQSVLYTYRYSLSELTGYLKGETGEPEVHDYTPLECYLFGRNKPVLDSIYPKWSWYALNFIRVNLQEMTISGCRIPYDSLHSMEKEGFPGQRKEDGSVFTDPEDGINYIGAWILKDPETGEMEYFYGSTAPDNQDREEIGEKYRSTLVIPGGKYAYSPYEEDMRQHGHGKLYGGHLRSRMISELMKSIVEYDDSRFIFEMYNERNELSVYFPVK